MAKNKFYVVWKGLNPGIYDNWAECKAQVDGQEGAKYKSFENREEAAKAFEAGYTHYLKTASSPKAVARLAPEAPIGNPINESLAVDAACSGNPGDMEYRGVYTATGQEIFHIGPLKEGTNNVGEFLALVHGLAKREATCRSIRIAATPSAGSRKRNAKPYWNVNRSTSRSSTSSSGPRNG